MELARLRLKLNELKDSMDTAIMEQDFLLAQTLKQEMDTVSAEQVKLHEEVQREKANIQKVNNFYVWSWQPWRSEVIEKNVLTV